MPTAEAQPAQKVFRVGILNASSTPRTAPIWAAFAHGLQELGYIEGQNLVIEYRKGDGQADRLPGLAAELAALPVDVILASGPEAVLRAASQATRTIPIVMMALNYDPLSNGYIASLARPGGNMTGVFFMQLTLSGKRLELLKKTLPQITSVFALYDKFAVDQLKATAEAASTLGLQLQSLELQDPPYDLESAMAAAVQAGAEALVVFGSPVFYSQRDQVTALAVKHRLPTMFPFRHWVELGGLMSYGANLTDMFRYAATYVDKILKGANPAHLPVEQPTTFELVINQKTAEQIGVAIPPIVLFQADKVIQ
jgi:putative ABC transport system substrate-binding protein